MAAKRALIVACDQHDDARLQQLRAPAADAEALQVVLSDPDVGGFAVDVVSNAHDQVVRRAVATFFRDRAPDDLLLLHMSCHGVKDESGHLYFAARDTDLALLSATAVSAEFVRSEMERSRSRRIVLLLDCCYSGAFSRGMRARGGNAVEIEERLGGRGRAVLTASSAMEYAFEAGEAADVGQPAPSVFTAALVDGLRSGMADRDGDGYISVDELYDHVFDHVRAATPNQTPQRFVDIEGQLLLARNPRAAVPASPLPEDVRRLAAHRSPHMRLAVAAELGDLMQSRPELAEHAVALLRTLATDDNADVAAAADAALGSQADVPQHSLTPARAEPAAPDLLGPRAGDYRRGSVIDRRYELRDRSEMGIGELWKAEDLRLERPVAIRLFDGAMAPGFERANRRMLQVARMAHPCIVTTFDWSASSHTPYVVTEWPRPHVPLATLLRKRARIDSQSVMSNLLDALQYAHGQGLVHGDISPPYVLVDPTMTESAKVGGWGLGWITEWDESMEDDFPIALAEYISPEVARGEPPSARSDIYSAGVIGYQLAAGQLPFTGNTPVEIALKHVTATPRPPSSINASISPPLENALLRALEKEPANRFASAHDFQRAMRSPPQARPERPRRRAQRAAASVGARDCPECGFVNPDGTRFCSRCGAFVGAPE